MTPTQYAVCKIAYFTAKESKGKRKSDALAHCQKLGINARAETFLASLPTQAILGIIDSLQGVQQRNRPDSLLWQAASDKLQPLFAEMARREKQR